MNIRLIKIEQESLLWVVETHGVMRAQTYHIHSIVKGHILPAGIKEKIVNVFSQFESFRNLNFKTENGLYAELYVRYL